jgi:hypothetical protein
LVGDRALIGQPYLRDPELRRAYAAEIAPRTAIALAKILREVFGPPPPPSGWASPSKSACAPAPAPARRVLDLGAGTGAAGDAVHAFFRTFPGGCAEIVSVDLVAGPGVVGADLAAPGPLPGVTGRFDIIVAAHLVNELFVGAPSPDRIRARAERIQTWCDALLAAGGTLIVLEPALRETSRDLLAVRDQLLGAADLRVVAPCLWTGLCPALARERDWCHDAATEEGGVMGQRPRRVDFSYLALRRGGAPPPVDPALFRIVSDALVEKGRLRLFGCGPAGRHALVRLDRHRAQANAAFDRLARGDLARVAGTSDAGDGRRLGPETVVEKLTAPAR